MSRDQRSVGSHPGGGGGEVDCDFQRGKGCWQKWLKKNIYYSYILTCPTVFFFFLDFFSFLFTLLLLKLLISFVLWNMIKFLSFLIFLIALFFLVTNLCLHAGFFLFSFLFSFSPSFSNLKILNLLLFFSTFITLFAFPTVTFPLNVYKSVNSS